MSIPVIVLGKSGTGKTMGCRNFGKDEVAVVNVLGKLMPFFDSEFKIVDVPTWQGRMEAKNGSRPFAIDAVTGYMAGETPPAVVIDDAGYTITEMFMRFQDDPQYQKNKYQIYTDIASTIYNAFMAIMTDGHTDRITYWIFHEDETIEDGVVPMTVGKMLNEKVNLLGLCTITLRSAYDGVDNGYVFEVGGANGKTPPGLFDGSDIQQYGDLKVENDLQKIDAAIRRKYRIPVNSGDNAVEKADNEEKENGNA